jgi:2,4-dienoyl-CoA reductase-like NADH-dependent reductase (Old Yellow Enzyme family)
MSNTERPVLFQPLTIRDCTFKNRVVMSPMCQYCAADDGKPNHWHETHWSTRAIGGVGLVFSESTAISAEGRLTPNDLVLSNEEQAEAFKKAIAVVHSYGAKFGIQINHCGRKSWGRTKGKSEFRLVSASPIAFDQGWETPDELSAADIEQIAQQFIKSAGLAVEVGADVVEIHAAHGYLFHQFLSPISNTREDAYGGSLENRAKFLIDVVKRVREKIGAGIPLFVRISCTDWAEPDGFTATDAVSVSRWLQEAGADLIDCSTGGTLPITNPPLGEGYQVLFAEKIKKETGMATAAVGLLTQPDFCNSVVEEQKCDLIFLGRELLRNPYWVLGAAKQYGITDLYPAQYVRGF